MAALHMVVSPECSCNLRSEHADLPTVTLVM